MPQRKSKNSSSTVWWWILWILLTIGSFFISVHFWTWLIAEKVGSMREKGVPILWVTAVFGSWMVLLIPLIIVMYNKVDKAYESARIRREITALKQAEKQIPFKSIFIEEQKRLLRKELSKKITQFPQAIKGGHLVNAVLRDGRKFENIFVAYKRDVLGIYGYDYLPFQVEEIADLEPVNLSNLPDFKIEDWLRLDGAGLKPNTS